MKTYITIIIAGALVVGGVWYAVSKNGSENQLSNNEENLQENTETSSNNELNKTESKSDSNIIKGGNLDGGSMDGLIEILNSRDSYICTVNTTSKGIVSTGKAYIQGENLRADFETNAPIFGLIQTHIITDENNVYTWTSMLPQGMKTTKIKGTSNNPADFITLAGQSDDPNAQYSYECQKKSFDKSVFKVPTDIVFNGAN